MIGAMPAVTVRHDRVKVNKRLKQSKFRLKSPWKISSANSTPTNPDCEPNYEIEEVSDYYIFGKVAI